VHLLTIQRKEPVTSPTVELVYITCRTEKNVIPAITSEPLLLSIDQFPLDRTRRTSVILISVVLAIVLFCSHYISTCNAVLKLSVK